MRRLASDALTKWKKAEKPVPLLVRGARQVGKTWLIREHAREYPSFLEINLESDPKFIPVFKEHLGNPEKIISILSHLTNVKIRTGKTLLFIDEIQESKDAILSLRYFKEKLPGMHVIGAGSLLEFTLKELSFPVGRIEFLSLFPLNFEEFLFAQKKKNLVDLIKAAEGPLPQTIHEHLLGEVALYGLIGGMPEVVHCYLENKNLAEAQDIQQRLTTTFRTDFYKYASKAKVEYLQKVFDGTPKLLGQKFKYSNIDREVRSRELSIAVDLLMDAGIIYKVCHSSSHGMPLRAQANTSKFKTFFLDIGLCNRILGLNLSQLYIDKKELIQNRGALAEQLVAQEIISYTKKNQNTELYYWHREARASEAEVDFIIPDGEKIMPIEVKSGEKGSLKSLHLFIQEKRPYIKRAIKVSSVNFMKQDFLETIPLYAVMKI